MADVLTGFGTALLASMIGAFSGGGSSFVLLPLLLLSTNLPYASALALTKTEALVLSVVSGSMHLKRNDLHKGFIAVLVICGVIGTAIGTYFVQYQLNELLFRRILGGLLLLVALILAHDKHSGVTDHNMRKLSPKVWAVTITYFTTVSVINGMYGGAAMLLVVFLVMYMRMSFIHAIAYAFISFILINGAHVAWLISTEPINWPMWGGVIVGGFVGSWLGTRWLYAKGNHWVKAAAITLMVCIGLTMLFTR